MMRSRNPIRCTRRPGQRVAGSAILALWMLALPPGAVTIGAELPDTIDRLRGGIVAVGTLNPTRQPRNQLRGTGFAVGDGHHVVTNAHVIPTLLDDAKREVLAVYSGHGRSMRTHQAEVIGRDEVHDLALLRVSPGGLDVLELGDSAGLREGQDIAFTGFPITHVLGLYHATHRGIIASITPVVIPAAQSRDLTAQQIELLRNPYKVLQLDATAYPGNSGSPVYRPADGRVVGVINAVLLKGTRENVLKDPSNITYAIPVQYVHELVRRHLRP